MIGKLVLGLLVIVLVVFALKLAFGFIGWMLGNVFAVGFGFALGWFIGREERRRSGS